MTRFLQGFDALSGAVLGEWLPLSLNYVDEYNAPGTLSASVRLEQWLGDPAIAPGKLGVRVVDDAGPSIEWSGIVWRARPSLGTRTVALSCAGWHSALRRRVNRSDLTWSATDQATIAAGLVAEAQRNLHAPAANARDLGIVTSGVTLTGTTRDRTYAAAERKNLGEALEQLAAVDGGFQFRVTESYEAGAPVRRLVIRDRTTPSSAVLMHGANVEVREFDISAEAMAHDVDFIAGMGDDRAIYTDHAAPNGWPSFDDVIAASDVSTSATAMGHIADRLARGALPYAMPSAIVTPANEAEVTAVVGDEARVIIQELGLDQQMMVRSVGWQGVAAARVATMTLGPVLT